ncbi:hypothetical protein NOJ05_14070 [Neorhizobium galegae]|uniref:hypothetical protein n=1 Tax=Neorhizobium galegae TaxID=399 RepID=UPI000621BC12|nr:hypothetical protein [Neorhizobium galegae]MCQ1778329.1 hypothetical protein [Neorhizobium galegae]MCQ1796696.1 hypothetical protein [Neorhizobium galegae]CDZ27987.1 Hypothetical protein NGAL_HAMBI490_28400 [Neorhizobium galegae bv. officinalis]
MNATTGIEHALRIALAANVALHARWNTVRWKFQKFGPAIGNQVNGDIATDLLLRQMEAEVLERVTQRPADFSTIHAESFLLHLTQYWLLNVYEVVRSSCQQAKRLDIPHEKLAALRDRLALVRIPIAKAEIAQANRLKPTIELVRQNAAEDEEPILYAADGSYIVPREMCGLTGSLAWWTIDLKSDDMKLISRRELSDETLAVFD